MNKHLLKKYTRYLTSIIPLSLRRLDNEFFNFLSILHDNEKKSYDEMRHYQFLKLKKIVNDAYFNTEFYKQKYDSFGFHPDHLICIDDLTNIPMLTKDEIRKFGKKMILSNYNKKVYTDYTSGTTGMPLKIYRDKKLLCREWASICYQWERVGYTPYDGRIELRGFIETDDDYLYFPDQKVLRINLIKLNSDNIIKIINKIKKTKYKFLHGYPSGIYKFATILKNNGIEVHPKAIMFASEILYDWQLQLIDEVFPLTKKIAHYGQAEKLALGAWTDLKKYSFIPSYGIVENLPETNELVATGFINEIMPFIRYKLMDTVSGFNHLPENDNKMLFPVVDNVNGRLGDITYTNSGEIIPTALPVFRFYQLKNISACKLIQNSLTDFQLLIEGNQHEAEEEAKKEVEKLKIIYGKCSKFEIVYMKHIPVDKSGKYRLIECRIKPNNIIQTNTKKLKND